MPVGATSALLQDPEKLIGQLKGESLGLMLYGSHARGDAGPGSDIDLLQLVSRSPRSYTTGLVSVVAYTPDQLDEMAGRGSLFAWHLRTEGVIVRDPDGLLGASLALHKGPAIDQALSRVGALSAILDLTQREFALYSNRAIRTARYLARTALYARSLESGETSFNLHAAAKAVGRPYFAQLLAPRPERVNDWDAFVAHRSALSELIGRLHSNPFNSLEALAVQSWGTDVQLASLAIQTLLPREGEIAYSSLPPPVL